VIRNIRDSEVRLKGLSIRVKGARRGNGGRASSNLIMRKCLLLGKRESHYSHGGWLSETRSN